MDVCYPLDKRMKLWICFLWVIIVFYLFTCVIILISSTTTKVYVTMSKFLVTRVEIPCKVLTNKMLKTKNYYLLFKNLLANITCCSIAQHNSLLEASKLKTST
jgi:hypothetical protein